MRTKKVDQLLQYLKSSIDIVEKAFYYDPLTDDSEEMIQDDTCNHIYIRNRSSADAQDVTLIRHNRGACLKYDLSVDYWLVLCMEKCYDSTKAVILLMSKIEAFDHRIVMQSAGTITHDVYKAETGKEIPNDDFKYVRIPITLLDDLSCQKIPDGLCEDKKC